MKPSQRDEMNDAFTRRSFLRTMGYSTAVAAFSPIRALAQGSAGSGPTIERLTIRNVPGSFYRPIAMNAVSDGPEGNTRSVSIIQLTLSDGTTGVGVMGYRSLDDRTVSGVKKHIIGTDPLDVYRWEGDRIQGFHPDFRSVFRNNPRFACFEAPILDVVGKRKDRPVHALFGPGVRDGVDAYDGTLYFKDVELERDADVIGELAARIKADGYRAIKMKVGRAFKWMEGESGVKRDIEAVAAARQSVGSNLNLMLDANDGYKNSVDRAVGFLEATHTYEPYWIEEIFPEEKNRYGRLLEELNERNVTVRIADGEDVYKNFDSRLQPFLEAGIFNVIQPDLRTAGFSNTLRAADLAARYGQVCVPHNWGSELGKLMTVHAAKIKENIPFAEDDRYTNHGIDTSAYLFRNGQWVAPDKPGWGIRLNEKYRRFEVFSDERVISSS